MKRMSAIPVRPPVRAARAAALLAICLVACTGAGAGGQAEPAQTCAASAATFWKGFRAAVVAEDSAGVAAMARFPLAVKATLDDSPTGTMDSARFRAQLPALLDTDSGLKAQPYPERALVRDTTTVPTPDCSGTGGSFQVGTFLFGFSDGRWALTTVFKEE